MSYNGSGVFNLVAGNPVVTGTTISSTWANNTLSDIATGLSSVITKDGQTTPTANIPMGGFKITGLGAPTTNGDALRFEDETALIAGIQAQTYTAFTTAGTSTAFTLTPVPAITSYVAGQSWWVTFHTTAGANPTLNINGLGATVFLVKKLQDGTYVNTNNMPAGAYRVTMISAGNAVVENVPPVVVGTVSQVAGVPTGAIIERGSNANGEYVRYADGTQICWFNSAATSRAMTSVFGPLFTLAAPTSRTFPMAFSVAPSVAHSITGSSGSTRIVVAGTSTNTTTCSFDLLSVVSITSNVNDSYIAIGRWF